MVVLVACLEDPSEPARVEAEAPNNVNDLDADASSWGLYATYDLHMVDHCIVFLHRTMNTSCTPQSSNLRRLDFRF
ncbi:hypothetical protein WH47_07456 [Habropoda laboriosa]|uniref:Uncharacterized protein n=1 Tax=Habropoda laboriosa TaxID=597456 RepID=A0A0L7QP87_9HYME|nr:hypothetical protein WH47_07456 [Habropoda laboriosa]